MLDKTLSESCPPFPTDLVIAAPREKTSRKAGQILNPHVGPLLPANGDNRVTDETYTDLACLAVCPSVRQRAGIMTGSKSYVGGGGGRASLLRKHCWVRLIGGRWQ